MNSATDTIAAIATAPGPAGLAVIRVSGPEALPIADRVFSSTGSAPSKRKNRTIAFGRILDQDGVILDECLLLLLRGPGSYTGEDTVEFQCHGGAVTARRILQRILQMGARLAEPGEFTQRAFLHGRMDLVQAEAVLDLIRAQTDRAASAAIEQLEGRLSQAFNTLYSSLLHVAADLEATLDFSDQELPESTIPSLLQQLNSGMRALEDLLATWSEGHLLREGALVVIAGQANAGKSTLMNALLGHDRAIVSPIPGTTRDTIEEQLVLEGIVLRLVDTAGLRSTDCHIEKEGIQRTHKYLQKADLYVYLLDASRGVTPGDQQNLAGLDPKKTIVVLNKVDLGNAVQTGQLQASAIIETCLLEHKGLTTLQSAIKTALQKTETPPHAVISERHRQLLLKTKNDLQEAISLLTSNQEDLIVPAISHLRSAIEYLGNVTGRTYHDELLSSIFSKFCIGK